MNDNEPATEKQIKKIYAVLHSLNIKSKDFKESQKIESIEKLTRRQASDWIEELERQEQENKTTQPKPKNMEECIKEAIRLVDTYIISGHVDDNTRALAITQLAIEIHKPNR